MAARSAVAALVTALVVTSAPVATATPPSVDNVVATIAKNIAAGKWALAEANIGALGKTIDNELTVRKVPVSLSSNPVDAELSAVQGRLQLLKADYARLNTAMIRLQDARKSTARQVISQVSVEFISKLNLINANGLLDVLDAADAAEAKGIARGFAQLRSLDKALRYVVDLKDSLRPAIKQAQRDRARLLELKAQMDKVIATYTPAGLTVPGTTTAPSVGSFAGTWSCLGPWGTLTITQDGSSVTGTYTHDSGRLEGTISGNTITARWSESPSYAGPRDAGPATATLSADGLSFSGSWAYDGGSGGSWTCSR